MKPKRPLLEPLHEPLTRLKLLLTSYKDACQAGRSEGENIREGKPGSRMPGRGQLWHHGSYKELEKAMDKLRGERPSQYFHLWVYFVVGDDHRARRIKAEKGLARLMELLPDELYVPDEISEAAGYLPSEARAYTRKRRMAA